MLSVVIDPLSPCGAAMGASEAASRARERGARLQSLHFSILSDRPGVRRSPALAELSAREADPRASDADPGTATGAPLHQPSTVRNHLKAIYRKVGVSSQSELIEWVASLSAAS
jgi:hypothetical protein